MLTKYNQSGGKYKLRGVSHKQWKKAGDILKILKILNMSQTCINIVYRPLNGSRMLTACKTSQEAVVLFLSLRQKLKGNTVLLLRNPRRSTKQCKFLVHRIL